MSEDTVTDLTRGVYRRLYSGFIKGQRINKLSLQAEAWFWRVFAVADDFGNYDADPELVKDATKGRRKVTTKQVERWLSEMESVELISFYHNRGERYLHIYKFELTQPAGKNGKRLKRFPLPGESDGIQVNPDSSSASDNHDDNDPEDDPEKARALDSPPFTSGEFLNALSDFEQHRKEIRHRLTPKARQAMYTDFLKWGELKSILAMREAIRNGWRGVFEPKPNGNGRHSNVESSLAAAERVAAKYEQRG